MPTFPRWRRRLAPASVSPSAARGSSAGVAGLENDSGWLMYRQQKVRNTNRHFSIEKWRQGGGHSFTRSAHG
jgi:hypothetical protein